MFNPEKTKWYKQSCATNLLCIAMPWLDIKTRMEKASGFVFPNDILIVVNEGGRTVMGHYFDYDLNLLQAKKIMDVMEKNPGHFTGLSERFYAGGVGMEGVGRRMSEMAVGDDGFRDTYKEFLEQNHRFWENSLYLDLLDPVEELVISRMFGDRTDQLSKKDINLLLSPKDPSNLQKEQMDMLEIYGLAKENGRDDMLVMDRLKEHSEKFYWIKNDYEKISYLDTSYYMGVLDTWLANSVLADEAKGVIVKMQELGKTKAALVASLGLDAKTATMLDLMNLFTNLRDDRKKFNCISNYFLTIAAEKVAKEKGYSLKTVLWANPEEVLRLLDEPELMEELEKRELYGCFSYADGQSLKFEADGHVTEIYRLIEEGLQKTEIRGNIANPGKAIGLARIVVGQDDFHKMQKDDVLVAAMTRPEFLPIMKLAAAIVTDEGGITCHAAIVARELGIPCIIGTQVATKMLKDGDKVEVNANHGTVIKL
jgi:phosphohistidine swiveling domain-containing protein